MIKHKEQTGTKRSDKQGLNDQGSSVPGHVVSGAEVIAALDLGAGAAAEVVQEVVGELDEVHHRLRALDDLSVQRRLDVGLKKDDIFIIFIIIFLAGNKLLHTFRLSF